MPETIRIEPQTVKVELGKSASITVVTDETGCKFEYVYWVSETDGVIEHEELTQGGRISIKGLTPGATRIAALLDNGAMAMATVTVHDPYARMPGDANDDGKVDAKDALLVMQYDAGWNVSINGYARRRQCGRQNRSGRCDPAVQACIRPAGGAETVHSEELITVKYLISAGKNRLIA